jgi:hypothetical protein
MAGEKALSVIVFDQAAVGGLGDAGIVAVSSHGAGPCRHEGGGGWVRQAADVCVQDCLQHHSLSPHAHRLIHPRIHSQFESESCISERPEMGTLSAVLKVVRTNSWGGEILRVWWAWLCRCLRSPDPAVCSHSLKEVSSMNLSH